MIHHQALDSIRELLAQAGAGPPKRITPPAHFHSSLILKHCTLGTNWALYINTLHIVKNLDTKYTLCSFSFFVISFYSWLTKCIWFSWPDPRPPGVVGHTGQWWCSQCKIPGGLEPHSCLSCRQLTFHTENKGFSHITIMHMGRERTELICEYRFRTLVKCWKK